MVYLTLIWLLLSAFLPENEPPPFLLVLGVAQDAGYPQAGCRKECCVAVQSGSQPGALVSSLALVDPVSREAWLLDATPDFPAQLQELTERDLRLAGIFLTHAHIGHYTGLMHLGREVMGASSLPVYAMPRMGAFLERNGPWSQLVELDNIELRALRADSAIVLNERLRITPVPVPHRDEFSETAGFRAEGPNASALFIPDIDKWERWERDIRKEVREVDYALLDGTFYANGEIPGRDMSEIPHPFIEESMKLFATLPAEERGKVRFIHFNHTNPVLRAGSPARQEVEERGFRIAVEGEVLSL